MAQTNTKIMLHTPILPLLNQTTHNVNVNNLSTVHQMVNAYTETYNIPRQDMTITPVNHTYDSVQPPSKQDSTTIRLLF